MPPAHFPFASKSLPGLPDDEGVRVRQVLLTVGVNECIGGSVRPAVHHAFRALVPPVPGKHKHVRLAGGGVTANHQLISLAHDRPAAMKNHHHDRQERSKGSSNEAMVIYREGKQTTLK